MRQTISWNRTLIDHKLEAVLIAASKDIPRKHFFLDVISVITACSWVSLCLVGSIFGHQVDTQLKEGHVYKCIINDQRVSTIVKI